MGYGRVSGLGGEYGDVSAGGYRLPPGGGGYAGLPTDGGYTSGGGYVALPSVGGG